MFVGVLWLTRNDWIFENVGGLQSSVLGSGLKEQKLVFSVVW